MEEPGNNFSCCVIISGVALSDGSGTIRVEFAGLNVAAGQTQTPRQLTINNIRTMGGIFFNKFIDIKNKVMLLVS